jgi:WD repeat-containing protein 35
MFIYLSKKIAIPNGVKLHSLAWNPDHGWIAAGGDDGLLKVLKLDAPRPSSTAAPSNLSMNQTLEGHQGAVVCSTWNANYRKLTTSDQNGLIIVWMLHKGVWFEEMINNRNKSVVKAMKWTADGQKICIVYEDGAVIVGSVDGNRLWGKEMETGLLNVEWSPDASYILFVTTESELHVYDLLGVKVKQIPTLSALEDSKERRKRTSNAKVVAVHWYDGMEGYADASAPTLAVAYADGRVQLSRGSDDADPVIIDSGLKLRECKWDTRGTTLALAGTSDERDKKGGDSVVRFYSPRGVKLRSLKVPGGGTNALSWEGGGLRIALAVDAYIYFANIRPKYEWGFFAGEVIVAAYQPPERSGTAVVFWDLRTGDKVKKRANGLRHVKAVGDHCVTICDEVDEQSKRTTHKIALRDAIGVPVEERSSPVSPEFCCLTEHFCCVASERYVYVWQFARQQSVKGREQKVQKELISLREAGGREKVLDVENAVMALDEFLKGERDEDKPRDPITAVAASERALFVGRRTGDVVEFAFPSLKRKCVHRYHSAPWLLRANCDASKLAIVDAHGRLGILDLSAADTERRTKPKNELGEDMESKEEAKEEVQSVMKLERKDCWDVRWADDDPDSFAAMEKTRLCVYKDLVAEDPVVCSGYLASFTGLEIKSVVLENVVQSPDKVQKDSIVTNDTARLRVLKEKISQSGAGDAYGFVDADPHPTLWRHLAEAALEGLDLQCADKAFVRCSDYQGIQFVKRLRALSDRMKRKAEVAAFFGRFEEAEQIYRDIDRKDLAIDLRTRLGDWQRVAELVRSGAGDDRSLQNSYLKLGDHYAGRSRWVRAREFYDLGGDVEKRADCYYRLEDFGSLEKLLASLPERHPLLGELGRMFESVGLHAPAVDAFLRANEPKQAVDCCVLLNQWERATEIAEDHGYQQIEGLLAKRSGQLLREGQKLLAVELYRKANRPTDAAKLLATIAEEVGVKNACPVLAKKLHVLAALEVERFRKKALDLTTTGDIAQTTAVTLDTLMTQDNDTGTGAARKIMDNAWRGAACYHYYCLAHRQLYDASYVDAMRTAIRLAEYEDILPKVDIYSLVALSAYHAKDWYVCSKAFIKLETLDEPPELDDGRESYLEEIQKLAIDIFTDQAPGAKSPNNLHECYFQCLDMGIPYACCTKTGRAVLDGRTLKCKTCRHHAIESALDGANNCPLCHAPYPDEYQP